MSERRVFWSVSFLIFWTQDLLVHLSWCIQRLLPRCCLLPWRFDKSGKLEPYVGEALSQFLELLIIVSSSQEEFYVALENFSHVMS